MNKHRVNRSKSLFFSSAENAHVKSAYTRLKDNILFYGIDGNKKIIQVESTISGEGKTTVSANLAVSLGMSNKKVIVIDLDFVRPRLHRPFQMENVNGLGDYIIGSNTKEEIITKTSYDNVYIIKRGVEIVNSSAVLTSDKLKNLLDQLRDEFDFIILDCPPILVVSDFIHISNLSDGVVYVIAYGQTKKKQVQEALSQLSNNRVEVIGSVFTFYDPKKSSSYDEYRYDNYKYYSYCDNKIN